MLNIAKGSMTEIIEHMADAIALGLANEAEAAETCSYARRARGHDRTHSLSALGHSASLLRTTTAPNPRTPEPTL